MSGWSTEAHRSPPRRFVPGLVFPLVIAACALTACSRHDPAPTENVLRISQRNEPATLDPHLATLPDEAFIIRALSEGLVTPDPDGGTPLPAVAERWTTSPDGLVWTFHLRPAARWSNGDPVTAGDFVSSIHRVLDPSTAAPKVPMFFTLRHARAYWQGTVTDFAAVGVAARDDHTLVLTLEQPNPELLALVASSPWIPVHRPTVEAYGRRWTKPGHFVGNGPFTLTDWSPNQHILVRKNPLYWDHPAVLLDAIRFIAFDSNDTEERAFRAGQLDVTMTVPFSKQETYRRATPTVLHTAPLYETRYLALNTTRPPLNDARVRHALSLALDRRTLVERVLQGDRTPAYRFVPPGLGQPIAPPLTEDLAEAARLLAEAGYPGGRGFPTLELTAWGSGNQVIEALQERWRTGLGITISVVQREARTHLAALATINFDIAFITAIPDYASPSDLLQDYTTGDAANYPHWSNPDYDRLMATHDFAGAEALLLRELPIIPLYYNAQNYLLRSRVHGWRADALWTRFYKHVSVDRD